MIQDPSTKYFVFGPAILAFGIIGGRTLNRSAQARLHHTLSSPPRRPRRYQAPTELALPAFRNEPPGFEDDPFVKAMGGPEEVRALRDRLDKALTF